jgi:outer membrane protein TolC
MALSLLMVAAAAQVARPQSQPPPSMMISLDEAIRLAIEHNHALKAARTQIQQSRAQEITAAIRLNPVFDYDDLFVPLTPHDFNSTTLNQITEFDVGLSYTWERGHKRLARIRAARDQTAVTQSQVSDNERSLSFNVGQQFIGVLLAKSNLEFAKQDLKSFQETVMTDATTAYEAAKEGDTVVRLYESGYLKQAQDSRDISEYACKRGAASLLDYLDAERSYRATQLAYRQALATYMPALEQLREAVGTMNLPQGFGWRS